MEHPTDIFKKIKNFTDRYGFPIFSLGFLLLGFKLLPDYGLGFDSPKNFEEGLINLNYLLTGHAALKDQFSLAFQIHGAFFFMISEIFTRIFCNGLGWLDPLSARHAIAPVLIFIFTNIYYSFLRKRTGATTAFLACTILLTFPVFFGNTFINIKDVPLFVCFSLAVLSFYEWRDSGFQRSRYLYGFFLALGLALLSKLYAVMLFAVLALWLATLQWQSRSKKGATSSETPNLKQLWSRRNIYHSLAGCTMVLVLIALFFMPAVYSVEDKIIFFRIKGRVVDKLVTYGNQGWSLYPWIQVLFVTPVLTLVMATFGMMETLLEKSRTAFSLLMLSWFFLVMFTACTPLFPVYHGIRLFMVVLIPLCFFTAVGIMGAAELVGKIVPIKKTWGIWFLGALLIAFQIAGIVQTHPYETTFFNGLAGGLRGAQKKRIPDSGDYWLTGYCEAMRWLNKNVPSGADLLVPSNDDLRLIRYYPLRNDLYLNRITQTPLPRNSFLILEPGETCWVNVPKILRKKIEAEVSSMKKVHEIRRQGGEILTIYYKA